MRLDDDDDDNDTNVFQKSLIDWCKHRPQQLSSMCLAEFDATHVTNYEPEDSMCDALPDLESDSTSTQITADWQFWQNEQM